MGVENGRGGQVKMSKSPTFYITENKKRDMWFRKSGTHKASKCMEGCTLAAPQFAVQLNFTLMDTVTAAAIYY